MRAAVEAAGRRRLGLPSYSPDRNPIEPASAKRKRALPADEHREIPNLVTFLRAAGATCRPDECRACIRHCGYDTPAMPPS